MGVSYCPVTTPGLQKGLFVQHTREEAICLFVPRIILISLKYAYNSNACVKP